MKLNAQTPKQSLNKAFLKQPVNRDDINAFKANLQTLLGKINPNESEEHHKNFVRDFLRDTFYKSDYEMNTKGKQDLVIHIGKDASNKVGVILEAKKPKSPEMISADNPNKKALHELILYYLNERNEADNFELKNLIITDIHQWFIFDANLFDKQIYRNTNIKRLYQTYKTDKKDNPFFYGELQKIIANFDETIDCAVFDIRDYETALKNDDLKDDEILIELFKILSPNHLLKVPFADDSNKLDKYFYTELLHIIGLEEIKDKGKLKIQRKDEARRDAGSLIENAIAIIETKDCLYKVKNLESYGETRDERLFGVALELCLTWINRVLFLKLLEAQLVDYHNGNRDYRFLDTNTIQDFDELFTLFHQVLAKLPEDRARNIKAKYARVPYLNSSLFEYSDIENETVTIESLKNTIPLSLISTTVLKEVRNQRGALPTLEYLFKFLDAYDFASEGAEGITENNRSLINASVLGKVFEKINGYKDGSIYTPGFITMYMCRQAIRLAVVQKFKDAYGWNISEFTDIKNYLADYRSADKIKEFNALINSLHLCDPAVGSGHFLVSSLNEIIAIKCELGILADEHGERFRDVEITIENDELTVFDTERNEFFKYRINDGKPNNKEAQRLQKTLFHEKQTLIENCLFGVDINPNSVKICRLRLWIELLKNAYYKESSNYAELETLPNIDINIKQGNSLLSRFALDADLTQILKQIKYSIEDYRNFVLGYKETRDREKKREFEAKIKQIKDDFKTQLFFFSPERRKLADFENQLKASESKQFLFGESDEEKAKRFKDEETLKAKIAKAKETVKQIEENAIYKNAFEWRFEFPEVLDDEGKFTGFDIVIGNPPYIYRKYEYEGLKSYFNGSYESTEGNFDLYKFFIEKTNRITAQKGFSSLIIPNTFLTANTFKKLRTFIINNSTVLEIFDLGEHIFDGITVENVILHQKKIITDSYEIDVKIKRERNTPFEQLGRFYQLNLKNVFKNENAFNIYLDKTTNSLVQKIRVNSVNLGKIAYCTVGINTGYIKSEMTAKEKIDETYHKMLSGRDIGINSVDWKGGWIKYDKQFVNSFGDRGRTLPPEFVFTQEKILVQRTRRGLKRKLVCYYDSEGYYNLNRLSNIVSTDKSFSLKYIHSLLNSRLLDYFFNVYFNEYEVKPLHLSQLPIKQIEEKDQQPFVALVDQILELKKEGKDTQALENEIDALVYQLYDLTDEEIRIVEGRNVI